MSPLASPLSDRRTAYLLVGLVAALVFANSLANGFAYDDPQIIVTNRQLHSFETLPGALLRPYWPVEYGKELGLWRPVTTGLFGVQYILGGGSPLPFHIVNVLGHALVSVLVVAVLLELATLPVALLAGLLFAVHPVHVEAVANVVGLAEVLSTAAILAACLIHLRSPATTSWRSALAMGALYLVAFGSKESAITLPGLIFLLDAARREMRFGDLPEYLRRRGPVYVVMALVAALILFGRMKILGSIANPLGPLGADLLTEIPRIWTLAEIWVHYVRLWVFPLDLSADYSPNVIPISIGWQATNSVGLVLALGVLAMTLILWRRSAMGAGVTTARIAAFGVIWFIIAISPVSNVFFLAGVLLAERTLYLPSVGLAAASAWLLLRLLGARPRLGQAVLVLALVLSCLRTWTRTPTWRDNAHVFTTMMEDYPHSGRSQWILGDQFLSTGRVSEGLVSYRAAINILGPHYTLLTEISKKLIDLERYRAAEVLLGFAWNGDPEFPLAPALLASVRAEQGDPFGAERYARVSLALEDRDPVRQHLLAWALASQGRWEEAEAVRATAEGQARVRFWQQWLYLAARAARDGRSPEEVAPLLDSAWANTRTETARAVVDSVGSADFGYTPRPVEPAAGEDVNR